MSILIASKSSHSNQLLTKSTTSSKVYFLWADTFTFDLIEVLDVIVEVVEVEEHNSIFM